MTKVLASAISGTVCQSHTGLITVPCEVCIWVPSKTHRRYEHEPFNIAHGHEIISPLLYLVDYFFVSFTPLFLSVEAQYSQNFSMRLRTRCSETKLMYVR